MSIVGIQNGAVSACVSRRSEEHTSELQSLRHLVCRLLLEKKKLDCSHVLVHSSHSGGQVDTMQTADTTPCSTLSNATHSVGEPCYDFSHTTLTSRPPPVPD